MPSANLTNKSQTNTNYHCICFWPLWSYEKSAFLQAQHRVRPGTHWSPSNKVLPASCAISCLDTDRARKSECLQTLQVYHHGHIFRSQCVPREILEGLGTKAVLQHHVSGRTIRSYKAFCWYRHMLHTLECWGWIPFTPYRPHLCCRSALQHFISFALHGSD